MKKGLFPVLSLLTGVAAGVRITKKIEQDKRKQAEKAFGKISALFHMMNQWIKVKQDGKNLASYLKKNEYKKIAIYGMSYVGETLLQELKDTEIEVAYGIDRRTDSIRIGIDVVSPYGSLDSVDAVVVTAIDFFDEIEELLKKKVKCPIISIEDIVFEV